MLEEADSGRGQELLEGAGAISRETASDSEVESSEAGTVEWTGMFFTPNELQVSQCTCCANCVPDQKGAVGAKWDQ